MAKLERISPYHGELILRASGGDQHLLEAKMTPTTRLHRIFMLLAGTSVLALPRQGDPADFTLELTPDSTYTTGCFPPCKCPIQFVPGMQGTLKFRLVESGQFFDSYEVEADLSVPSTPPRLLRGSGSYRLGGEIAFLQEMSLKLSTDGGASEDFQSGAVPGPSEFPEKLSIQLAIGHQECFDTLLEIHAEKSAPRAFRRGDCNADGHTDISDPISGLLFLFGGGAAPACEDACDANDDGKQDISDAVTTLSSLFAGGAPLPPPEDECGQDPTVDELACGSFAPCAGSCDAQAAAIAAETTIVGACSAVVRLDYDTLAILGWQLGCAKYSQVTEETAREQAKADTGYGGGRALNPADPSDLFVFYESPGDFGGAGIVSARTGQSVFGGSIVWLGTGEITYPKEWRGSASLGVDCARFEGEVPARGYDLAAGTAGLQEAEIQAALDVVRETALFEGLQSSGYIFDAVVVLYPRSVGSFDPSTAEWIVVVNGVFLE